MRFKDLKDKKNIYVIQRHRATRLHYDLRLEIEGVLKSWAIPKIPPKEKGIKRLAVQTDDHLIEYANYEGNTVEAGNKTDTVKIWDKGTFRIEEKEKDKLVIHINGKKLKGRYCLIKFKEQEKNWLFLKC